MNYSSIEKILKDLKYEDDELKIQFSLAGDLLKDTDEEGTDYELATCNVEAIGKKTGERLEFVTDLVKLPVKTTTGYKIKGSFKQVVSAYVLSNGWYLNEGKTPKESKYLTARAKGFPAKIYLHEGILMIDNGKKVPLAVFLKAITRKSYQELMLLLGPENINVVLSFDPENEPNLVKCMRQTLTDVLDMKGRQASYISKMSTLEMEMEIRRRLYNTNYIDMGDTCAVRLATSMLYQERCKGLYLEEDIEIGDYRFEKGLSLSPRDLEMLDYLPIKEIKVSSVEKQEFTSRKYYSHNFQALGRELAEPIETGGLKIPEGTVLTIPLIKKIESTAVRTIVLKGKGSSVEYMSRPLSSNEFSNEDFIGILQVYMDFLNGIKSEDDSLSLANQNLIDLNIKTSSVIRKNCEYIVRSLKDGFGSIESADLLSNALSLDRVNADGVLEYIKNPATKESQQAEVNNTVQKISKDFRVSKSIKRGTADMVAVSDSQFGALDPNDTPESSKVGLTQVRTIFSRINEYGFAEAPFIRVHEGKVESKEIVYLSATLQKGVPYAEWDETFHTIDENGNEVLKDFITCMRDGEIVKVPLKEVRYMQYSPYDTMSPARVTINLVNHSAPRRQTMGSNHVKSSHVVLKGERPWVSSGGDSLLQDGIFRAKDILHSVILSHSLFRGKEEKDCETLTLLLKSKSVGKDSMTLYLEVVEMNTTISFEVPYMIKSSSGAVFSTYINPAPGLKYKWDDIVAYAANCDIRHYEKEFFANFGNMEVTPETFNQALGIGKNLCVAFKTQESSTIDDSMLINRDLIGDDSLTSILLTTVTYELKEPRRDAKTAREEYEEFVSLKGTNSSLPEKNSIIQPGSEVLRIVKNVRSLLDGNFVESNYISIPYKDLKEAQVVGAEIKGNKAEVKLLRYNTIEVGDKLSGRHGSKTVVAKIVPPQEMPYCPETGLITSIVVNPLSIPSRANVSIILESCLGMAAKEKGHIKIITPFKDGVLDYTKDIQDQMNLHPRVLVDGRTGLPFDRPINLGFMYIYKSEHMVDKKLKAVGDNSPIDPLYRQPSKGDGAQAQGEMETWVYSNKGAHNIVQAMFSTNSSDSGSLLVRKSKIEKGISDLKVQGNNSNDEILQILFRSAGIDPEIDDDFTMHFKPLTNKKIRSLSPFAISPGAHDKLRSTEIFGDLKGFLQPRRIWGWFELGVDIIHPYILIKGKLHEFLMIRRFERVGSKDKRFQGFRVTPKIEPCAGKDIVDLIYGDSILYCRDGEAPVVVPKNLIGQALEDKRNLSYQEDNDEIPGLEGLVPVLGMNAVIYMFKNTDFNITKNYYRMRCENAESPGRIVKYKEILSNIEEFENSGTQLTDYIINSFPVVPLNFRPESNQHQAKQDLDYFYGRIMDAANRCIKSVDYNPTLVKDLCERINDFLGTNFRGRKSFDEDKIKYKPLLKMFTSSGGKDKKGDLREHVVKTRPLNSARTVIVPNSDVTRTPVEIGVPLHIALTIWETPIIKNLKDEFGEAYELTDKEWSAILEVMATSATQFKRRATRYFSLQDETYNEIYRKIYKVVKDYVEGSDRFGSDEEYMDFSVVLAGRQPTLHEFSIRGYRPYLVKHKCIEIHALVCPAYNADFDGDQMWLAAMITREEKKEALELFSPENSTLNPKDGSIVLKPSQDIVLGIYYMTIFKNNVEDLNSLEYYKDNIKYYSNVESIELDLEAGFLKVYDVVLLNNKGKMYPSTAGRIILNSLVPQGMGFTDKPFDNHFNFNFINNESQYYSLMFDGIIANPKGERTGVKYSKLNDMITYVIRNFSNKEYMAFSQKLAELGFFYSDRSGISLSIDDFKQRDTTEKIINKADLIADLIDSRFRLGLISVKERRSEMIQLYTKAHDRVKRDYLTHIDQDNNLYIMFDSGARGDAGQITQSAAMVGVLQKNKSETLEYPIRSSYIKGLTCFESLNTTYSARLSISSTQNETQNAGVITRLAVYTLEGVKIVEEDCGKGYQSTKIDLGDFINKIVKDGNYKTGYEVKDLIGKTLLGPKEALKYIKHFSQDNVLNERNINILIKNKIQRVVTSDGEYQFLYKVTSLFNSLYYYRSAQDLPHLIDGKFISKETIDYLNEVQPETFMVRDMLRCGSVGGVCQKCYGAEYDTIQYPKVGYGASIRSAQSIGEPAAQITMNVHNKGGAAGEAPNQGVEFYLKVLRQGIAGDHKGPPVAPVSGYLDYGFNGSLVLTPDQPVEGLVNSDHWRLHDGKLILRSEDVKVSPGEYVQKNQILGTGIPQTREMIWGEGEDTFYFNQMNLLRWHYETFEKSNIPVFARHFELLARTQTSLVKLIGTDHPEYKEGQIVFKTEADKIKSEGYSVDYVFQRQNYLSTITHYSGALSAMIYEDLGYTLGKYITSQSSSKVDSPIAKIASGQPINQNKVKKFYSIDVSDDVVETSQDLVNEIDSEDFMETLLKRPQETGTVQEMDLELDDLLSGIGEPVLEEEIEPSKESGNRDYKVKVEGDSKITSF